MVGDCTGETIAITTADCVSYVTAWMCMPGNHLRDGQGFEVICCRYESHFMSYLHALTQ